jgi:tRNA(fMet)-specific endonuclease VapC
VKYLLDTNTCVFALKQRSRVVEQLRKCVPEDLGVAIITVAELWFGARKSVRPEATRREIDAFLKPFEVLPFDHEAADEYARLRFELERIGRPIGERDLLIASIAVARRLIVVTHNVSEFGRLAGLIVEDWS